MEFMKMKNWKRQLCKKGAILGLAGILALGCSGTTVMAAKTVNGTLNGVACHGRIDKDTTSVFGSTSCDRGGVTIKVKVTGYFKLGSNYYYSVGYGSNTSGGAGATAKKKVPEMAVIGGKGIHTISFNTHVWEGKTNFGTIPSNATKL